MNLKKILIFIFLLLFINSVFSQELPETIITDSGELNNVDLQQQGNMQLEVLKQILLINEKLENTASKEDLLAVAQELNKLDDSRINGVIIFFVIIHIATISMMYGIYFYLKMKKRI